MAGAERATLGERAPGPALRRAALAALETAGGAEGHIAIALVTPEEIRRLNGHHRGHDVETDVLSFPVDGGDPVQGPLELGDVVICAERAEDLERAAVHGVLHLLGYDHEADAGEMLALEDLVVDRLR